MNRYLKLVNFELSRFMKIYLVLIGITIVAQITGVIVTAKKYLGRANEMIFGESMERAQFIEQFGQFSFLDFTRSLWFMGPIGLCIAALVFYIFLIWYRDWFGKNSFIYRLLMLPTARINVLLAKATSIFLMVLGLVAIQFILMPLETTVLKWVVPIDFRADMPVGEIIHNSNYLTILLPESFIEFILYYGAGFMVITILFTAILFERSYRWKGFLIGLAYVFIALAVFASPFLLMVFLNQDYLYPLELLAAEIILGLIVIAVSMRTSNLLLKKKITV